MSDAAQDSRGSNSDAAGRVADAVRQFELALRGASAGGSLPVIEMIVAAAAEADRDLLRENLLQFERQWRQRDEPQAMADPPSSALIAGDTSSSALGVTIGLPQGAFASAPVPLTPAKADAPTDFWDPNAQAQPPSPGVAFTLDAVAAAIRAKVESKRPTIPGYELISELGRGGMGVVYKAVQMKLHRVVALKMVLAGAHASADQLARFATEAEAVAALQHPNIVQIYEIGEQAGLPFFSLEFVDGQPLDRRLAGKPQAPLEAAKLMEPIARAMHFAHESGIVHRDLKPANVLLTREGVPKVTDFGLAKKLESDSSQTKSGTLMGTPSYMAPEQARGEVHLAGPAADIHSLGAMLYEMLVGRPPYLGATPVETIMQVIHSEPVAPRTLMPKLSRDIETICLKCLQKEPSRRYATSAELADDLQRFERGEPILARPISRPERAWRWCRRNPRIASLSAALVLLLATAGVAMGKLAVDASRERQASAETRKLAEQRLEEATTAISSGDYRRALDVLHGRGVRIDTDRHLTDVRDRWQTLQTQVEVFAKFKRLLSAAHFAAFTGDRDDRVKAREILQRLLALYAEIRDHLGRGAAGLPPLNEGQLRLFRENAFEAFLLAEYVELNLGGSSSDETRRVQALRQALDWIEEAESILPGTRTLCVQRSYVWRALGNEESADAEVQRAKTIEPTSAVDHFWHGWAEYLRGNAVRAAGDRVQAAERYRAAIAEYAAVLRLNPRDFWAHTQWAACRLELGDPADAVIGMTAALEIDPDQAMAYVNRAVAQIALGRLNDARLDLAAALVRNPRCAEAYFKRALLETHRNENDLALSDLDKAIEIKPHYEDAWLNRAEMYRTMKRQNEALSDLAQLIEIAQDPTIAHLRRAGLLRELGRKEEAIVDYDAVLQRNPAHIDARRCRAILRAELNRDDDSIADWNELLQLHPQDTDALLRRAEICRKLKQNDLALADYTRLIECGHELAAVYRHRAELYRELGRSHEAIADFGEVVKSRPKDADAWLQRALLEFNAGQNEAARDDATRVIELAPRSPLPYQIRAMVNLLKLKELERSLTDWQKLTELNPNDAMAHYCVGIIELGRRNFDRALKSLDGAIELKPEHVEAHWARSQTLLVQKRYDDALAAINLIIEKLAPGRPAAVNCRGDVYRVMGRLEQAAADYRAFFARRRAQPDAEYLRAAVNAWVSLALVLDMQGKSDEARDCFQQLVDSIPDSADALLERVQDYRNHGRFDEALADCDQAAKLDPKSVLPGLARASIVAARGDDVAAVAETENLLARAPVGDGHALWAAARVFSLASAAAEARLGGSSPSAIPQTYADRAADLLAEALGRGFHDLIYPEQNRLPLDPALTAVRGHPRVRKLLGD